MPKKKTGKGHVKESATPKKHRGAKGAKKSHSTPKKDY